MNQKQITPQPQALRFTRPLETNISPIYLDWFKNENKLRAGTAPICNLLEPQSSVYKSQKKIELIEISPDQKKTKQINCNVTQQLFQPKQFFSKFHQSEPNDCLVNPKGAKKAQNYQQFISGLQKQKPVVQSQVSVSISNIGCETQNSQQEGVRPQTSLGGQRLGRIKNNQIKNIEDRKDNRAQKLPNLNGEAARANLDNKESKKKDQFQQGNSRYKFQNKLSEKIKTQNLIKNIYLNHQYKQESQFVMKKKINPLQESSKNDDFLKIVINQNKNNTKIKQTTNNFEKQKTEINFQKLQSNLDPNFIQLFAFGD